MICSTNIIGQVLQRLERNRERSLRLEFKDVWRSMFGRVPEDREATTAKMRCKAASTLFSDSTTPDRTHKSSIGSRSIRETRYFDPCLSAKKRRKKGANKVRTLGGGQRGEGRPQAWCETWLIYVRKWPINWRNRCAVRTSSAPASQCQSRGNARAISLRLA